MDNEKQPWSMPKPPQDVKAIIKKLDSNIKLTPTEHEKLGQWESGQGGFGGVMDRIDTNKQ